MRYSTGEQLPWRQAYYGHMRGVASPAKNLVTKDSDGTKEAQLMEKTRGSDVVAIIIVDIPVIEEFSLCGEWRDTHFPDNRQGGP